MTTTVIKKICSVCGSADVIRDAIVAWSEPAQAWEPVSVLDSGDCNACGNSGNLAIEDVEVTEGEPTKSQIVERIAADLGLPVIQIKASEAAPDDQRGFPILRSYAEKIINDFDAITEAEHALLLKDHLARQRWNKACDHAIDMFLKKHDSDCATHNEATDIAKVKD